MKPIVVYAPDFDETSGGAIVLHYLVDRLRNIGTEAYVYPFFGLTDYPKRPYLAPITSFTCLVRNLVRRTMTFRRFRTHPTMDTPIAPRKILRDAIVVYPEIVSGNPLKAKHVVRWLLNKPGFFDNDIIFGKGELTFFYQAAFMDGHEWVDPDNLLRVRWVRHDVYVDKGITERKGACRLIRKGKITGSVVPEDDEAIVVDGMSHVEMAEIFNRCKFFYCHDPYTMYSYYAACCGCIPVVVPQPNLSREDWRSTYPFKHGIAYGIEEAQWASDTRDQLLQEFAAQQKLEDEILKNFVKKLCAEFQASDL